MLYVLDYIQFSTESGKFSWFGCSNFLQKNLADRKKLSVVGCEVHSL
jgi:hypothetical protein